MAYSSKDGDFANAIGGETEDGEQKNGSAACNDDDDGVTDVRHLEHDRQQIALEQQQVQSHADHHQCQRLLTKNT